MAKKGFFGSIFKRVFSPVRVAVSVAFDTVVENISEYVKDYLTSLMSFFVGIFFATFFYIGLNVILILFLSKVFGVDILISVSILTIINMFLSILFLKYSKDKYERKK